MATLSKDLGLKILSGAQGAEWAARAQRICGIVRNVVGQEPPSAEPLPEEPGSPPPELFSLRGDAKERPEAIRVGCTVAAAFITREFALLNELLHPEVWMLWPNGQLLKHDRDVLIDALSKRSGKPSSAQLAERRAYTPSELRSTFARGMAEAMERMFETTSEIAVTMAFEAKQGLLAFGMVWMSLNDELQWKAHSVVLPSIDEAYRFSNTPSPDEDDAIRYADRIARHFLLGHDRTLRSLRNHFFDRVVFGEDVLSPEKIAAKAGEGDHKIEANELIFTGSLLGKLEDIPVADKIKRRAKDFWGKPIEKLNLKVVKTKVNEGFVSSVMLGVKDPAQDAIHWRLAGLFV